MAKFAAVGNCVPSATPAEISPQLGLRQVRAGRRNGQRGAAHLKAIIWTLIIAAMFYTGFKVIPVLFAEYQFQDGLQTVARFSSANRWDNAKTRQAVAAEALKDEIPVQDEDIKVIGSAGNVDITVDYSVTVDLSVYQWTIHFHPEVSNKALF